MAKDFSTMEDSNRSSNPSIHEVSDPARRIVLRGGLAGLAGLAALQGLVLGGCATTAPAAPVLDRSLGFKPVPASSADRLTVPEGYTAQVLAPWGEPVGLAGNMPAFKLDASNSAAEQAAQMGMHHDGLQYYALDGSQRGLLAINHEYTDDGLLHPGGQQSWTPEKVQKAQAAHGIAVIEVALQGGASLFQTRYEPGAP